MDPHRSFPDDPASRWYGTDSERDRPGTDELRYGDNVFRVPDQRGGGQDQPYGGLGDSHERGYSGSGTFGQPEPYDPHRLDAGRTGLDPGQPTFDHTRSFGDPTATAERSLGFDVSTTTPLAPAAPSPSLGTPPVTSPGTTAAGLTGPGVTAGPPGSRPGEHPAAHSQEAPRMHAEPIDRAALRRGPVSAARVGQGFYRTRRPLIAIVFAVLAVILAIPALRLLASAAFGDRASTTGIVGGTFLLIGLPAFAIGLYSLATGSGRPPGQPSATDFLRPPLAYLAVGIALFLAAALAAG